MEAGLPPSLEVLSLPVPIIEHLHIAILVDSIQLFLRADHMERVVLMLQPSLHGLRRPETPVLHIKILSEVEQRGVALDIELHGRLLIFGGVDLGDFGFEVLILGQLLQLRGELFAMVAPGGVEVHEQLRVLF